MANPTNLLLVLALGAVGLVLLAAIGYLVQRRREPQARPEVDLATAWGVWFGEVRDWSPRERAAVERLQGQGDAAAEALKQTLEDTIESVLASPQPTAELRRAIMEAADHVVLTERLGDGSVTEASDSIVAIGVLRRFAKLRFHDHAQDDWFAHYKQVASMNAKNVATMVRKTVDGDVTGMESALHDPLSAAMRQVRERLLRYPPRIPVTRGDELTGSDVNERLHPTQKQVDLLTGTMRKRFDKLFAGQVYNLPGAPPVDPVGAFRIDAGLLYALLSTYFRHPKDAWRKIMTEALGPYAAAVQNDDELLEHATEFARAWSGSPQGALSAAMQSSWRLAFERPEGETAMTAADGSALDEPTVVAGMVEHAGPLVGAIRDVIEKH